MAFNIFTTKRVSCFGQYDRIDDLITFKLRGDKRPVHWQFLVDELHVSPVCKCFDPLFVWHFSYLFSRDQRFLAVFPMFHERFLNPASIARSNVQTTLHAAEEEADA